MLMGEIDDELSFGDSGNGRAHRRTWHSHLRLRLSILLQPPERDSARPKRL